MFRFLLIVVPAIVSASSEATPLLESGLLGADDECDPSGDSGSGACSMNALQHRAEQLQQAASLPAMNASLQEDAEGPVSFTTACYGFTGGTCLTQQCNADRGASCQRGMCVCPEGECTDADGICHKQTNVEVAGEFRLYNAKYSKYKMYFQRVSAFGQIKSTAMPPWTNMGQDVFRLYRVPGSTTAFILGSNKWHNSVVAMRPTTGTAVSPFAAFSVKINTMTIPWNPDTLMLQVCSLRRQSYPDYVMIGSLGAHGLPVWAYLHHGSWFVYGSVTGPGMGGYWRPDPPLPEGMLPDCPE
mmetsp:Transcript_103151/g.300831  ORF Transcript_103151/g.300831 Transcript_103151/m.300831 type:complete len:300 (-) Transcript_103151:62-961(-)